MINGVSSMGGLMGGMSTSQVRPDPEQMFTKMDSNGDGVVDRTEFEAFEAEAPQRPDRPEGTEDIFTLMDADGDGLVTQEESADFAAQMKERMEAMGGPMPMPPDTAGDTTSTLLEMLNSEDDGEQSVSEDAIQQYLQSHGLQSQSVLDLLG